VHFAAAGGKHPEQWYGWEAGKHAATPKTMNIIDRVRVSSPDAMNSKIDAEIDARIREYAGKSTEDLTRRIEELDGERDIEQWLEMNASALAFTGLALGMTVSRKWLVLPALVLPFLFQHAVQGWCPPVPIMRSMGVRTRKEIDVEKFALKALRGDFDGVAMGARDEILAAMRS
jgi:hypothetical protein